MDPWSEKINSSPALLKSQELKKVLKGLNLKKYTDQDRHFLERTEAVVDSVISRVSDSDPRLVNNTALTAIGTSMANVISYWNSWMNGSGDEYLRTHIQNEMDTIVAQIVVLSPAMDIPEARESISTLRRSVARHRAIVDELVAQIKEKGSLADTTIDEKIAAATQEMEELQTSITDLDTELSTIKDSSAQLATEQTAAFNKAETERSTTFNKLLSDKQKELGTSLEDLKTETQKEIQVIRDRVESDETAAADAKKRIEEILGIVGEEALIGDYSNNAKDERSAADFWRWVAAGSLAVAIIVAIWFSFTINETTAWQRVVAKIAIVLSFGGLAGYAAKQSSEHRHAQRDAEQMALQLKAIKPYLGDIGDQSKQDDLLTKIAGRLFGQKKTVSSDKKEENPIVLAQLVESIYELVKRNRQ